MRLGGIKAEEAKNHPDKNIITRAIGVKEDVEADIYEYRLKKGDIIPVSYTHLHRRAEKWEFEKYVRSVTRC